MIDVSASFHSLFKTGDNAGHDFQQLTGGRGLCEIAVTPEVHFNSSFISLNLPNADRTSFPLLLSYVELHALPLRNNSPPTPSCGLKF